MRNADIVWKRLSRDIKDVFYLPGGGSAYLVDALGQSEINAVCCLHEQGAGFAAVAYAQLNGLGVCMTTSGPGATNALTPCLAAWLDSVPVLFISGQVQTKWMAYPGMRSRGTQEGPIIEMVKSVTKWCRQLDKNDDVELMVDFAIKTAKLGRPGPVWLDIPLDISMKEVNHVG